MLATESRFRLVPYEEATPAVRAIYDDVMRTLQVPFVLNWFKCQGSNATLLKGNWAKLKSTMIEGEVPPVLKQLIIYNVSRHRGCAYCAAAHGIFADSMSAMISSDPGFRATDLEAPQIPAAYRTAIEVVSLAALAPQEFSDADYDRLFSAGFSEAEVQELLAQADLVNMLNTIADLSRIRLDNELAEAAQ